MTRAMPQRSEVVVAAFDLDGTLTEGGSVFGWLRTVAGTRTAVTAVASMAPSMAAAAIRGGSTADKHKERLFTQLLRDRPIDEVRELSSTYAATHVATELRTETKARLDWHVASGHHVVIVSASPALYVEPIGAILGVRGVVATNLAVDPNGRMTGRYDGKNCRGSEKFSRVTSWMRSEGLLGSSVQAPILWAYGNSRGDLRLLRAADHGVSCAKLGRLSKLSGFPSLDDVVAQTPGEDPS